MSDGHTAQTQETEEAQEAQGYEASRQGEAYSEAQGLARKRGNRSSHGYEVTAKRGR